MADAITTLLANPTDAAADKIVSLDKAMHSTLRTTCVATLLKAGHAENALPQNATANINCRIFPGVDPEVIRQKLVQLAADAEVKITGGAVRNAPAPVPPLTPAIMGPLEKLTRKYYPGVPVIPVLQAGATDGAFFNAIGIPTYGIMPIFIGPDLGNVHGLNEYISVESLLTGREFLHELIQAYASQK
jgi:acetylornithine deacetylase/succinyl-diaminopimelate desuccinylase-like protein